MLVSLGGRPPADDPASLLLACHERIRRFTALAGRLAAADAPDAELAEAAERVLRYFTEALPLHAEDEDRSIRPRLLTRRPDLHAALDAMTAEHGPIDRAIAAAVPHWRAVAAEPARRHALAADLDRAAAALAAQFDRHLAAEERDLLPAIAALPPEDQAAIRDEMRARRHGNP